MPPDWHSGIGAMSVGGCVLFSDMLAQKICSPKIHPISQNPRAQTCLLSRFDTKHESVGVGVCSGFPRCIASGNRCRLLFLLLLLEPGKQERVR